MTQHHMRRADRKINEPEELSQILRSGKYAIIAMSSENEPYIVTLSYGYDHANQALYFHCALSGQKIDFIHSNPFVCATVILDNGYVKDQCEHHYASVVLRGKMEVVKELDEKKHGLDVLLHHLEENPEPIQARNIKDDQSFDRVAILRLQIEELTGKRGQ